MENTLEESADGNKKIIYFILFGIVFILLIGGIFIFSTKKEEIKEPQEICNLGSNYTCNELQNNYSYCIDNCITKTATKCNDYYIKFSDMDNNTCGYGCCYNISGSENCGIKPLAYLCKTGDMQVSFNISEQEVILNTNKYIKNILEVKNG